MNYMGKIRQQLPYWVIAYALMFSVVIWCVENLRGKILLRLKKETHICCVAHISCVDSNVKDMLEICC